MVSDYFPYQIPLPSISGFVCAVDWNMWKSVPAALGRCAADHRPLRSRPSAHPKSILAAAMQQQ